MNKYMWIYFRLWEKEANTRLKKCFDFKNYD